MKWNDVITKPVIDRLITVLVGAVCITVVFLVIQGTRSKNKYIREVKNDYAVTKGWILDYEETLNSDLGSRTSITYTYEVGGKRYLRNIDAAKRFSECYNGETIGNACERKRFWVIYSKEDPSKSLINLQIDIQNTANPVFPETVDEFI